MALANPLQPLLDARGCAILDGGLATELERKGYHLDNLLWSAQLLLKNPAAIAEVHYDYFAAGADIVTTASYQASYAGLERAGLGKDAAKEVLLQSTAIAREARSRYLADHPGRALPLLIAASMGPYGAALGDGSEYTGAYRPGPDALAEFHHDRFETLAQSEADFLAFETIPSFEELWCLQALLRRFPETPVWISVSCGDAAHMRDGTHIGLAQKLLAGLPNLVAFGINCTAPQHIWPLVALLAPQATVPIAVYPNSGEGWDAQRRTWTPAPPETSLAALAPRWCVAGARIIGGCCRTTPETIAEIAEALRRR